MTLFILLINNKSTKRIIKQATKLYAYLFGACSIILSVTLVFHHKDSIYQWLVAQSKESYAIATELPKPELEPVFPLVEQIQLRESVRLQAPTIGQHPQLPRGCEVTSLAMLLRYYDVEVDKMELAQKIKKDKTTYKQTDEGIYFGNPNEGFVGDMYSFSNPGLGVYHGPIADLAREYLGDQVLDFSGGSFYQIFQHINADRPVWVITNTAYKKLDDSHFQTWQTDQGEIKITMKEHSVLVTGYDEEYIYFNDPMKAEIRKAPINNFREAWVQMGKQAITVIKP